MEIRFLFASVEDGGSLIPSPIRQMLKDGLVTAISADGKSGELPVRLPGLFFRAVTLLPEI